MIGTTLWARTLRPALLGWVLLVAGGAPGCDPCTKAVWDGRNRCDDCDYMPDKPGPQATLSLACDGTRLLAVDPTGKCEGVREPSSASDAPSLWEGRPLFPGLDATVAELGTYCLYEWMGPEGKQGDVPLPAGVTGASDDCTFVTPQADFTPWAYDRLVAAIGPETALPSTSTGGVRTRVAVLDTSPAGAPLPRILPGATSEHGETLAYMIQATTCVNPESCPVDVRTRLVMPLTTERQGTARIVHALPEGGNMGTLLDVAEGMWAEIQSYRFELAEAAAVHIDSASVPTQLVYNESFAWGDFNGAQRCGAEPQGSEDELVKALFGVFEAAACVGAVHVAAAGNHTGGLALSQGLLCPALWHRAIHPSVDRCRALFGEPEYTLIEDHFAALVGLKGEPVREIFTPGGDALVSVGGTDFDRHPIAMSRPNACPELSALGVGGTAKRPLPSSDCPAGAACTFYPFLNGTSVAAAIVSAKLATDWYADPELTPALALLGLQAQGTLDADMSRHGGCGCDSPVASCSTHWIGSPEGLSPGSQNPQPNIDVKSSVARPVTGHQAWQLDPLPVCLSKIPQCAAESGAAALMAYPVPREPACTRCVLMNKDPTIQSQPDIWSNPALWVEKNPRITASDIQKATLVVEDANGKAQLTMEIAPEQLVLAPGSNDTTSLTKLEMDIGFVAARAWISVYDVDGYSSSQQIFVIE